MQVGCRVFHILSYPLTIESNSITNVYSTLRSTQDILDHSTTRFGRDIVEPESTCARSEGDSRCCAATVRRRWRPGFLDR